MKKIIVASVMTMTLVTGAFADVKVGLGYTLADLNGASGLFGEPANIRIPIDFDFGLRIEPEVAFGFKTDDDPNWAKVTTTTRKLAIGAYYKLWNVEKVNFYAGGRLAYSNNEREYEPYVGTTLPYTDETTTLGLQGLFGAEYMFTEDFSIAAQGGLELMSSTESDSRAGHSDADVTSVGTVGHILLHYFF